MVFSAVLSLVLLLSLLPLVLAEETLLKIVATEGLTKNLNERDCHAIDETKKVVQIGLWERCYSVPWEQALPALRAFGPDSSTYQTTIKACRKQYGVNQKAKDVELSAKAKKCFASYISDLSLTIAGQIETAFASLPKAARKVVVEKCKDQALVYFYNSCSYNQIKKILEETEGLFSAGAHTGITNQADLDKVLASADIDKKFKQLKESLEEKCPSPVMFDCAKEYILDLKTSAEVYGQALIPSIGIHSAYLECRGVGDDCHEFTPKDCDRFNFEKCRCKSGQRFNQCTNDLYSEVRDLDLMNLPYVSNISSDKKPSPAGDTLAGARQKSQSQFGASRVLSCRCRFDEDYAKGHTDECKKHPLEEKRLKGSNVDPVQLEKICLNYDKKKDTVRMANEERQEEKKKLAEEYKTGIYLPLPVLPDFPIEGTEPPVQADLSIFPPMVGKRPDCDKFIPSQFCGHGGTYDFRHYEREEDGDVKHTKIPSQQIGADKVSDLMNDVYETIGDHMEKDLMTFTSDIFMEKFLQIAYLGDGAELFDHNKNKLKSTMKEAGCFSDNQGNSSDKRVDDMASNLTSLVDHLSNKKSPDKGQKRYRNNMAQAAQCTHVIAKRIAALQHKLGMDVVISQTLLKDKDISSLDPITRTVANTVTSFFGIRQFMKDWPFQTGLSDYAKRPCSYFKIRHGSPLDGDGKGNLIDYEAPDSKRLVIDPQEEGGGYLHCDRETKQDCQDFNIAVSREGYCGEVAREFQLMTQELGALHSTYPMLAEDFEPGGGLPAEKDKAYERIALQGDGIDPRIKNYQSTFEDDGQGNLKYKPCMSHFTKPPPNFTGAIEDAAQAKKDLVNQHIGGRTQKTLDVVLEELKDLCEKSEDKLDAIVKDGKLMDLFYNCDRSRFGVITSVFLDESHYDVPQSQTPMDPVEYAKIENEMLKKLEGLESGIKEKTRAVSKEQCQEKQDSGWAFCRWNDNVKKKDLRNELIAGFIQTAFDVAGPMMASKALPSIGSLLTKRGIFNATVGAAVGYGTGYAVSKALVGDPTLKARINVAAYKTGIKSDPKEYTDAMSALEEFEKHNPYQQAGEEGAITGLFGSLLLHKKPATMSRAKRAIDGLENIVTDDFTKLTKGQKALVKKADQVLKELFPPHLHQKVLAKSPVAKKKILEALINKAVREGKELEELALKPKIKPSADELALQARQEKIKTVKKELKDELKLKDKDIDDFLTQLTKKKWCKGN